MTPKVSICKKPLRQKTICQSTGMKQALCHIQDKYTCQQTQVKQLTLPFAIDAAFSPFDMSLARTELRSAWNWSSSFCVCTQLRGSHFCIKYNPALSMYSSRCAFCSRSSLIPCKKIIRTVIYKIWCHTLQLVIYPTKAQLKPNEL